MAGQRSSNNRTIDIQIVEAFSKLGVMLPLDWKHDSVAGTDIMLAAINTALYFINKDKRSDGSRGNSPGKGNGKSPKITPEKEREAVRWLNQTPHEA